jgi:hypothetical protein
MAEALLILVVLALIFAAVSFFPNTAGFNLVAVAVILLSIAMLITKGH